MISFSLVDLARIVPQFHLTVLSVCAMLGFPSRFGFSVVFIARRGRPPCPDVALNLPFRVVRLHSPSSVTPLSEGVLCVSTSRYL